MAWTNRPDVAFPPQIVSRSASSCSRITAAQGSVLSPGAYGICVSLCVYVLDNAIIIVIYIYLYISLYIL